VTPKNYVIICQITENVFTVKIFRSLDTVKITEGKTSRLAKRISHGNIKMIQQA
jgi:hypothetical protein